MKTFKIFGIAAVAIGILTALTLESCSAEQITAYKNKSGAQLWGENCMRCHNYRIPAERSRREWEIIVHHMRVRANLTAEEHRLILQFLQVAN